MREGEEIYFCKRIIESNATVERFELPQKIKLKRFYFSVQPMRNGYMDVQIYGEQVVNYEKALCLPYLKWKDYFHEGDRFYLHKKPNAYDLDNQFAENADYVVDGVYLQNKAISLTLKKRD